jgi:hypothetical protein
MLQRFSAMRDTQTPPGAGRHPDGRGPVKLRPEWLTRLTPFFTERERRQAGCQHQLFFSQVEFCDNLIFRM